MPGSVRSHPISGSEASRSYHPVSSASASPLYAKLTRSHKRSQDSLRSSSSSSIALDSSAADAYSYVRSHDSPGVIHRRPPLSVSSSSSSSKAFTIVGRSSSISSSIETPSTPPTPSASISASSPFIKPTSACPNARSTSVASRRRQQLSPPAVQTAKAEAKMLDDDFSLPPVSVSASSSGGSKSNRILGPDGQLYTQGEAAKLGLIIRTACEACRNRKLKCSGTLPENGGCERCNSDGIQCVYSARAPIGRPKKRKAEEGEDTTVTPAPSLCSPAVRSVSQSSIKARGKSKESLGHVPINVPARVKTEETAFLDSPLAGRERYPFTASPALHHAHRSAYLSEQSHLSVSPAHSDTIKHHSPQDENQASFMAPQPFGLYEDPLPTPSVPIASGRSPRIATTQTVWSQHQIPFTMTPSETMTPQPLISPALTANTFGNGRSNQSSGAQASSSSAKLPSLDDLSVAAFLQSLDTLEISPAELFQQRQQQHMFSGETSSSGTPVNTMSYGLGTPLEYTNAGVAPNMNQWTASSVEEWASGSAILQPGLSFAVPADFSWWDLGINGADFGSSVAASLAATPTNESSSMAFPAGRAVQAQMSASPSHGSHGSFADGSSVTADSSPAITGPAGRSRRPTFSADQLWPRGADAGMGQGQIQHAIAATETGLGWSTLPGPTHVTDAPSSPVESQIKEEGSCCASKSVESDSMPPANAGSQQTGKTEHAAVNASCCSSKSASKTPPAEAPKEASCCAGKKANCEKQISQTRSAPKAEAKSCCSGHSAEASSATARGATEHLIEMGPLSTSVAVSGSTRELDSERKRHAAMHSHHPSKVHCVPNPSGKGCTCLCDMSVALLSVKQVLRETDPHKAPASQSTSTNSQSKARNTFATDTIQLTLTASQAIAAQCACSADCPTCQSDPSTEISASLLVSTALQIYARAVRILREGFAASSMATNGKPEREADASTSPAAVAQGSFGGLDVTIGTYKPSASNAKKIALYAIKLELKDLRRALGKISRMAQNFNSNSSSSSSSAARLSQKRDADANRSEAAAASVESTSEQANGQGMNPIDQLVILKLYRQLTELLKTVEGLEDAA